MTTDTAPEAAEITPEQAYAAHLRKRAKRLVRNRRLASSYSPRRARRIALLNATAAHFEEMT